MQRSKRQEISWDCHAELFRQEVENADDIRMSVRLFNACRGDQQRFCAGVEYGANRVKDCLEEHLTHQKFSKECRTEMSTMMQARARDFRLDPALRRACADDIDGLCGYMEDQIDGVESMQGNVINCLQDMYDDLKSGECKKAVHKAFERASTDYRLHTPLAEKCFDDTRRNCAAHTPGSARVITCLQDSREALQPECRTALFDLEVRMAEDIDFQFPLKAHCAAEIKELCASVEHGHARMVQCLQEHLSAREMGSECRAEVRRSTNRMAQDYRLNYRLKIACDKDMQAVCDGACFEDGQACGGTMLRCLQDNIDDLESAECRKEVQYFVKMEVTDFRNDVMLAEACKVDVDKHCADVEPGEGRVLECLRMHRCALPVIPAIQGHCVLLHRLDREGSGADDLITWAAEHHELLVMDSLSKTRLLGVLCQRMLAVAVSFAAHKLAASTMLRCFQLQAKAVLPTQGGPERAVRAGGARALAAAEPRHPPPTEAHEAVRWRDGHLLQVHQARRRPHVHVPAGAYQEAQLRRRVPP